MGWGGTITLMFLCTHRHRNLIIFLAVLQTQALLFHDQIPVGWGGVGWDNNVHVPVYTHNDDDDDDDDGDDDDGGDDDDDDPHDHDHDFHGCTSEGNSGRTSEWEAGCTSEWSPLRTRPMASVPPAPRPAAQEKGLETCVKLDIHTQATEMPWCHGSGHDFWSLPCCALDLRIIGLGHAVALAGYTTAVQPAVLEKSTNLLADGCTIPI